MKNRPLSLVLLGALALCTVAAPAWADVFRTNDGTTYDGTVIKEDGTHAWVRCVPGKVFKVALADVAERTAAETSAYDRYLELQQATKADAKSAQGWFDLHLFLAEQAESAPDERAAKSIAKEAEKALDRVLKLEPDHAAARDANGEVQFEGVWVKKADLERKKAEIRRRKLLVEWEKTVGLPVQLHQSEHWLLIDATEDGDLVGRAELMEEAYRLACEVLGVDDLWGGPAPIITVPTREDYHRMVDHYNPTVWKMKEAWVAIAKHEQTGGAWREKPEPMQVAWPIHGQEEMWSFLVNNVGHMSVWKRWGRPPVMAWLEEGLAAWLETEVMGEQITTSVGFKSTRSGSGTTDKPRRGAGEKKDGESLREAQNEWRDAFVESIESDDFPPLRKFLTMELGEYGPEHEGGALGLVTYLIQRGGEDFAKLERALHAHRNVHDRSYDLDAPFKAVFEVEVVEDFEKDFRSWVLSEW